MNDHEQTLRDAIIAAFDAYQLASPVGETLTDKQIALVNRTISSLLVPLELIAP